MRDVSGFSTTDIPCLAFESSFLGDNNLLIIFFHPVFKCLLPTLNNCYLFLYDACSVVEPEPVKKLRLRYSKK